MFVDHTVETAPSESRRAMTATEKRFGYLPVAIARYAESPQLLDGFLKLSAMFETTSLDPLARETMIMTVAARYRCHLCVAMHSAKLAQLDADPGLVAALRAEKPAPDERLAAMQSFTHTVIDTAGDVPAPALDAFLAAGFTKRHALDVVFGIGIYTMSTFANRLTDAPVDEPLASHAWSPAT